MRRSLATFLLATALLSQPFLVFAEDPAPGAPDPNNVLTAVIPEQTALLEQAKALGLHQDEKTAWFNDNTNVLSATGEEKTFVYTTAFDREDTMHVKKGLSAQITYYIDGFVGPGDSHGLAYGDYYDKLHLFAPAPDRNFSGNQFGTKEVLQYWQGRCSQWSGPSMSLKSYFDSFPSKIGAIRMTADQAGQISALFKQMDQNTDKMLDPAPPIFTFHPCINAGRNFLFNLYQVADQHANNEWDCVYNYFLNPDVSPFQGSTCKRSRADWVWPIPAPSTPPKTFRFSALNPDVSIGMNWERACNAMGIEGCNTSKCPQHLSEPAGGFPNCPADLVLKYQRDVEKDNAALQVKVDEVLKAAGASTADAAADAAALQAFTLGKGTVLGLNLPLSSITLPQVIARVIKQLLSVVGALALLFFVWGGMRWMLARGVPEEIAKAKKIIVAAVSGLIAIFASYTILTLIINSLT